MNRQNCSKKIDALIKSGRLFERSLKGLNPFNGATYFAGIIIRNFFARV